MSEGLITVESPGKIKTWRACSGMDVIATMGHWKDLPKHSMGIDFTNNYEHTFEVTNEDVYKNLRRKAKGKDVYIAADDDREGFAIGYMTYMAVKDIASNVYQLLTKEITPDGIKEALANKIEYKKINIDLYYAFLARRLSDKMAGFILSPYFSENLAPDAFIKGKFEYSAGRVQSPAVKLVYDKEMSIRAFLKKAELDPDSIKYYSISAFVNIDNKKIELAHENSKIKDINEARNLLEKINNSTATVSSVESKIKRANPSAPYTTSTFQQDCSTKLGIDGTKAMKIAQKLYEGIPGLSVIGGLITYMRTDSVRVNDKSIDSLRDYIASIFGADRLPASKNIFKNKNSQNDAHEAIRPTNINFDSNELSGEDKAVYDLIVSRTVASQMKPAVANVTSVLFDIESEIFGLKCVSIEDKGYTEVYKSDLGKEVEVPKLNIGDNYLVNESKINEHKEKPPARYNEASLTKKLEAEGMGRPSTYADINNLIIKRGYVEQLGSKKIKPLGLTKKGETFVQYGLKHPTTDWIFDYSFTRSLEDRLDFVANGKLDYLEVVEEVHEKMGKYVPKDRVQSSRDTGIDCPCCGSMIKDGGDKYFCSNYKYDKKTKLSTECQFITWKESAALDDEKLKALFAGESVSNKGSNFVLNANLVELSKNGQKNKSRDQFIQKKKDFTSVQCAMCGGNIARSENQYYCENNRLAKKNNKFVNVGTCDFRLNKSNEYLGYSLDEELLSKLLGGETIRLSNGKEIVFDRDNQYFIKDKNAKVYIAKSAGFDCPKCGSEMLDGDAAVNCSKKKKKTCKFNVFKHNKFKDYTLTTEQIKTLLEEGQFVLEDKRVLSFDKNETYPISIN